MGSDKSWLDFRGKALISHAIDQLNPYCDEILVSANDKKYETLGLRVISDVEKDLGPIGGIRSLLHELENSKILFAACDQPILFPNLLQNMIAHAENHNLVWLESPAGYIQSLPFITDRKLLPLVENQIEKADYKLQNLLRMAIESAGNKAQKIKITKEIPNINSLADLKAL